MRSRLGPSSARAGGELLSTSGFLDTGGEALIAIVGEFIRHAVEHFAERGVEVGGEEIGKKMDRSLAFNVVLLVLCVLFLIAMTVWIAISGL
jgi:hypothetical protein